MAKEETIEALKTRIAEYEKLLTEVLGKKKSAGVITAGPEDELYRLRSDRGDSLFLASAVKDLHIGDAVMMTDDVIVKKLPESLQVKKPMPKFNALTWGEIGGMKSQIEEIRTSVEQPLNHAKLYKEFGAKPIKGIMLYGPPGCGKTLIAKAIATTVLGKLTDKNASSFIYIKGPELLNMYVGATEENIRNIFSECREHKQKTGVRSVVFIDEAEAILPERGSRVSSDVESTIVPMFLSEMDGFEEDSPLVILATNKPNSLDRAILREGRIDLKIKISRPTQADAVDIFKIYLGKTKVAEDGLAEKAAEIMFERAENSQISGAFIATAVNVAVESAIARKIADSKVKTGVTMEDIINSFNKITKDEDTRIAAVA